MLLEVCRWLVPAALSAAGGIGLALWMHESEVAGWSAPRTAAAAPERARQPHPNETPGAFESTPTAPFRTRSATPAPAHPEQLESLARRLKTEAQVDVEAALAALLVLPSHARSYLAEDLIRHAAERAPLQTVHWLEANVTDASLREHLLSSAYAGLATTDPAFALNRARALTNPEARHLAAHRAIESWAQADPAAAFEWVRGERGAGATESLVTVLQVYVEHDPVQAGEVVLSLPEGEARHRLVGQYASTLAASDAPAAAAWLSQLPEDAVTGSALSSVFEHWAEQDPWMAIEQASLADGELAFELVGRVVHSMAATRPDVLASSLHRLPECFRPLVAQRLASAWAEKRPRLTRRWVDALPPGEVRDEAQRALEAPPGLELRGRRG